MFVLVRVVSDPIVNVGLRYEPIPRESTMTQRQVAYNVRTGSLSRRPKGDPCRELWLQRLSLVEIAALLTIAVLLVAGLLVSRTVTPVDIQTTALRIEQGDTLWTIASAHPVTGLTTAQTADFIARCNRLESGAIAAGAILEVPSHAESSSVASR